MDRPAPLRVVLSVVGKFHMFDLARQLHSRGALAAVFTGYPRYKLHDAHLPADKVHTYPWFRVPYMAMASTGRFSHAQLGFIDHLCYTTLDGHAARHLPPCDVFVGLAGCGLITGQEARKRGGRYVCDAGSSHIRSQNELLAEELAHWRVGDESAHPRVIERTEQEYALADVITLPSSFSARSFVARGVAPHKLRVLPYGVDLEAFHPDGAPQADSFDVLFAGGACLRKGVPYLLQAFQQIKHPRKRLWFAGAFPAPLQQQMRRAGLWSDEIHLLGHLNRDQLRARMSRSHVLVLPSIEDGFGLVMAQAMACGCPVIASENTGVAELFNDGEAGSIVPIRRPDVLADRLQQLIDEPGTRQRMSAHAQRLVKQLGGWQDYGDQALGIYAEPLRAAA